MHNKTKTNTEPTQTMGGGEGMGLRCILLALNLHPRFVVVKTQNCLARMEAS